MIHKEIQLIVLNFNRSVLLIELRNLTKKKKIKEYNN